MQFEKHFRYFENGYLNYRRVTEDQYRDTGFLYLDARIETLLLYLGISLRYAYIFKKVSLILPVLEVVFAFFLVSLKFILSLFWCFVTKKDNIQETDIIVPLGCPVFKMEDMLRALEGNARKKVSLTIPFIKNEYNVNELSLYSGLSLVDILTSYRDSCHTVMRMFYRYHKSDILFRSYSSFEFYLTCSYIEKSNASNSFIYYSIIERWAYAFSEDKLHDNILIQHGALSSDVNFVKFDPPATIYYINEGQQKFLETFLLNYPPANARYRPHISITANEKLLNNGKKNVLLVCCPTYFENEKRIICNVWNEEKSNLYIKTHPGFQRVTEYLELKKKFNFVILCKTDYPMVDFVVGYDSTLTYEYEDLGVRVLRYSDSMFENKIYEFVNGKE